MVEGRAKLCNSTLDRHEIPKLHYQQILQLKCPLISLELQPMLAVCLTEPVVSGATTYKSEYGQAPSCLLLLLTLSLFTPRVALVGSMSAVFFTVSSVSGTKIWGQVLLGESSFE